MNAASSATPGFSLSPKTADIHPGRRDTGSAANLLRQSALLEEPTAAAMSRTTRANPKKVASHLKALCELFVLNRINPHPSGTGKPIYLPLDCGIATHLGADRICAQEPCAPGSERFQSPRSDMAERTRDHSVTPSKRHRHERAFYADRDGDEKQVDFEKFLLS